MLLLQVRRCLVVVFLPTTLPVSHFPYLPGSPAFAVPAMSVTFLLLVSQFSGVLSTHPLRLAVVYS